MLYTLSILEVSDSTYEDIKKRVIDAGAPDIILSDGSIDLTHIAIRKEEKDGKDN